MARRYRKCFLWERCPFLRSLAIRSLDCLVGDVEEVLLVEDGDDGDEFLILE